MSNNCNSHCQGQLVLKPFPDDPNARPSLVFPTETELAHLCLVEYFLQARDNCIHNCIERCTMGVLSSVGCYEQAKHDLTVISNYLVNESRSWRLLATFCERGHHSAVFLNTVNFHLTIVHQGTQTFKQLMADLLEVPNNDEVKYFARAAFQFTEWAVRVFGAAASSITVTGHSLGGYLAQAATCLMKYQQPTQGWLKLNINNPGISVTKYTLTSPELNENSYHLHCVAFDSPGYRDLFESIAMFPKYQDDRLELHRVLDSVDVSVYVTTSKIANPMNRHLGSLFLMDPVNVHGIADIVNFWLQFDEPNSQVKLEKVIDWVNTKSRVGHVMNVMAGPSAMKTELFNPLEFRMSIFNESEKDFIRVLLMVRGGILSPSKSQVWANYFIGLPKFELLHKFQIMKLTGPAGVTKRGELLGYRNDSIRKFKVHAGEAVRSEMKMEIGHRNYFEWLYILKTQEYLEKIPRFQNVRTMAQLKACLADPHVKLIDLICPEGEGLVKICAAMAYELFRSSFQLDKEDEVKYLFTDSVSLRSLNSVLHSGASIRNLEFVSIEFTTQDDGNVLTALTSFLSAAPKLQKLVLLRLSDTREGNLEWRSLVIPQEELKFAYEDLSSDFQHKLERATISFKGEPVPLAKLVDLRQLTSNKLIPKLIGLELDNLDLGSSVPKLESDTFSETFYVERTSSVGNLDGDHARRMLKIENQGLVFLISSKTYDDAMQYLEWVYGENLTKKVIVTWADRSKFDNTTHKAIFDLNCEADLLDVKVFFESKGIPGCWISLEDRMVVDFQGKTDDILLSKPLHQIPQILGKLYESDELRFFISVPSTVILEMAPADDVLFFGPNEMRIETSSHKYLIFDNETLRSSIYNQFLQTLEHSRKSPCIMKVTLGGKVHVLQGLFNLADKSSWGKSKATMLLDDLPLVLKSQLVLIADEPGMGKSVAMKKLTRRCQYLEGELQIWTIFVELQSYRVEFSSLNEFDLGTCIEFVASIESAGHPSSSRSICSEILNILLHEAGRVCIYLDGFDEINEDLQSKVKNFVQTLLNKSKCRIFISTRLHMKNDIESAFQTKAHNLNPLTPLQSVQFLKKVWMSKVERESTATGNPMTNVEVERYAEFILHEFRRRIVESDASKFIGIPLQMFMLASVCLESFMEYHKLVLEVSSSISPVVMEDFCPDYFKNILLLYKTFVQKKFEIAMFTKNNLLPNSNPFLSLACMTDFNRIHKIFGFIFIFGMDICNKYFPNVPVTLSRVDAEGLLLGGLVQSLDGKRLCESLTSVDGLSNGDISWLHRTIAEFFSASFIVSHLKFSKEGQFVVQNDRLLQFCNAMLFLNKYDVVRYFVDQMIIHSDDSHPIFKNITNLIQNQVGQVPDDSLEDLKRENPILDCFGRTALHYFVLYMNCSGNEWERSLHRSIFLSNVHLLGIKDVFGSTPFSYTELNQHCGYGITHRYNLVLYVANIFRAEHILGRKLYIDLLSIPVDLAGTQDHEMWDKIIPYLKSGPPDSEMKEFVLKAANHFRDPSILTFVFKRGSKPRRGLSSFTRFFPAETWKMLLASSINAGDNERLDLILNLLANNVSDSDEQTDIKQVVEDLLRTHGLPLYKRMIDSRTKLDLIYFHVFVNNNSSKSQSELLNVLRSERFRSLRKCTYFLSMSRHEGIRHVITYLKLFHKVFLTNPEKSRDMEVIMDTCVDPLKRLSGNLLVLSNAALFLKHIWLFLKDSPNDVLDDVVKHHKQNIYDYILNTPQVLWEDEHLADEFLLIFGRTELGKKLILNSKDEKVKEFLARNPTLL